MKLQIKINEAVIKTITVKSDLNIRNATRHFTAERNSSRMWERNYALNLNICAGHPKGYSIFIPPTFDGN
jgi:hypothetical protein